MNQPPAQNALAEIDVPALISAGIGDFLVLLIYFFTFQNEKGSYVKSRFWMGGSRINNDCLDPVTVYSGGWIYRFHQTRSC